MDIRTQDLLEPVEDTSAVALPPGFAKALKEVRAAIACCRDASLPDGTVVAALLTELMPRLTQLYGSDRTVVMLHCIADEIAAGNVAQLTGYSTTSN
jgi:hypothetical protein